MEVFWHHCLARLEKELPAQQFTTWIRPLQVDALRTTEDELCLTAPNRFVLQWITDRFLTRIETLAGEQLGKPVKVCVALAVNEPVSTGQGASAANEVASEPVSHAAGPAVAAPVRAAPSPNVEARSNLIGDFTFDNFVPGKANALARAAAMQVAENPGTSYNPLFVYGGVGLGKTHLIHAVGNHVMSEQPGANVRYLHAAQYISDVVRAYQQRSFDAFKRYYHSLDLLL